MVKIKRSLAIVIGINEYSHIPKLKNAVSDAQELGLVLEEKYGYKVLPLLDEEANNEKLDQLLANLKKKTIPFKDEDLRVEQSYRLLFYFAGHGFAEEAQDSEDGKPAGYFMPQNAKGGNRDTWLSMQKVYQALSDLDCHHLLMIIDCCFAGRISWVVEGRNAAQPRKLYHQSYVRFIKHRTEQIITSSAHDEEAQDSYRFGRRGEKNGHSPFAYLLLKVLKGNTDGGRDKFIEAIFEDKVITVHELFTYLQNKLGKVAEGQTPALSQPRKYDRKTEEYVFFKGEYIFPLPDFNLQDLIPLKLDKSTNPYKGLASFESKDSQLFYGRKRLIEEPKKGLISMVNNHELTVVLGVSGSGKSSLVKAGLIPALKPEEWYVLNPMRPGESPLTALARSILPIINVDLVKQLIQVDFLDKILNSKTKQEQESRFNEEEKFNNLVKAWKGAIPEEKLLLVLDYFEQLKKLCSDSKKQDLLSKLKDNIENSLDPLIKKLQRDSQDLSEIIEKWNQNNQDIKLLLVIDQAEELITLCQDEPKQKRFLQLLANALGPKKLLGKLHILLTLRSEFEPQIRDLNKDKYEEADWQKAWQKCWQNGRFIVTPMNREELQQVIEEPAAQRALFFDSPKLVNDLIDEVVQMPGVLPLLSFTLSELYFKYLQAEENRERNDRTITEADYQDIGGVTRSLTETADKTYRELLEKEKVDSFTIRDVMLRMVAISSGELARRRAPTSELVYPEPKNEQVQKVIKVFVEKRLLVKGLDLKDREYVEPVHDALITGWTKIKNWLDEKQETFEKANLWFQIKKRLKANGSKSKKDLSDAEKSLKINLPLQREVTSAALKYDKVRKKQSKKAIDWLWDDDPRLPLAKQVCNSADSWLNQVETNFVQDSINQHEFKTHRNWGVAIGIVLVLSGLTIIALLQTIDAQNKTVNTTATLSESLLVSNQKLDSLVEAIRANKQLNNSFWAKSKFRDQVREQVKEALELAAFSTLHSKTLKGHQGRVEEIQFINGSKQLITLGADRTIRLWSLKGQQTAVFSPFQDGFSEITLSQDGNKLAASSYEGLVGLWDLKNQLPLTTDIGRELGEGASARVFFSPDQKKLVTENGDGNIRIWNFDGKQVAIFEGNIVASNPKVNLLASSDKDGNIRLHNLQGEQLSEFKTHQEYVRSILFSLNGKRLVTSNDNGNIRLWNLQGKHLAEFKGHQGSIRSILFSPNEKLLITNGFDDKSIRLWDIQGNQLNEFQGYKNTTSIFFTPDGQQLVTSGSDDSIRLWNLQGDQLNEFQGTSVAISPDSKQLAIGKDDGTIEIKNLLPKELKGENVVFSPDSKKLAIIGKNGYIFLWNLQTNHKVKIKGESAVFSADNSVVVVDEGHGNVSLWNLNAQQSTEIKKMKANFTSDSQHLFTKKDSKIYIWNLKGKLLVEIKGDWDWFTLSPDSQLLVANNKDTSWLYNIQGQKLVEIKGEYLDLKFIPDSKQLVTTEIDSVSELSKFRFWNFQGQQIDETIGQSIAFSPDNKHFAIINEDRTIELRNLQGHSVNHFKGNRVVFSPNGKVLGVYLGSGVFELRNLQGRLLAKIEGYFEKFSPSSDRLITVDDNYNVELWNINGKKLAEFKGSFNSVIFSLDGKKMITIEDDGSVKLWPIEIDGLVQWSCNWVYEYLKNNPNIIESDRNICKDI